MNFATKMVTRNIIYCIYIYIKGKIGELHCLLPFEVQAQWELVRWCRALQENVGNQEELPQLQEENYLKKKIKISK